MSINGTRVPATAEDLVSDLPRLVPAITVAEFLHVSARTLRKYIRSGRIRALRTSPTGSGRVLVAREEVARFIKSCEEANPFNG